MTAPHGHPRNGHPDDNFSEFAEELRLLAEAVLERVEPVLRRTAADGRTQWSSCAWCPVCAAAAVVRGEHHDVVAAIADHGTAIVTVLREALAGVPVEPVIPPDLDPESPEYQAWLHDSFGHGGYDDPAASGDSADSEAAVGDSEQADAASPESGASTPGARTAGGHTRPSAALAGLIARFAAGAQGIRTEHGPHGDSTADRAHGGFEGRAGAEDSTGSGHRAPADASGAGAVRRARGDSADTGTQSGVAAGRRERGETAGGGTASDDPLGRGPGTARRPGDQPAGRGATRAGYVPIDVTIKA